MFKLKTVLSAVLNYLWTSFGKKAIDDPKTPQDESDVFDKAVEAAIDALLDAALKEAKKKGVPLTPMDIAKKVVKDFPQVSLKDALDKVNKSLGRK